MPPANLEMAHGACRFRVPAQMRSRCVGRGAARALPRETVACQRQDGGVVKLGDATEGVIGLPQKSRQRVLWDNFRAPAKILQSKRFVGKGGAGLKALPRPKEGSARFALLRRGGRSRLIVARRSR